MEVANPISSVEGCQTMKHKEEETTSREKTFGSSH
jgi:hypothetical protein